MMMENDNYFAKVGETVTDATDYAQLQIDRFRLRLLDSFSTLLNSIFGAFLLVLLVSLALFFLAGALVVALSQWINSLVWAFVIVGGVFIVAAVVLFVLRRKLIVDAVVRMLSKAMFDIEKYDDHEQ